MVVLENVLQRREDLLREADDARTAILVDPHPLWLEAVEEAVGGAVRILGKASSLEEAQVLIDRLQPDVVVAEIAVSSDKVDGLAWLRATLERFQTKIIVLTASADQEYIDAVLACGASACVLKTAHPDDLRATIRQAFHHSIYLPPRGRSVAPVAAQPPQQPHDLTRRELEILFLVSEGHSNAKLAKMLWVTEQTVKFHLSNIYRKIGVSNRTEASRWAQLHGLLQGDSAPNRVA
jgi:DNA-binding NarL/FixJ family response regulator